MGVKRRTIVAVVPEVTPGTLVPDTASNVITTVDVSLSPGMEAISRDVMRGSFTKLPSLPGKQTASLTITAELRGSGVIGTAPEYSPLLKSAWGLEHIGVGGTVSPAYTASTTVFTVGGTALADEDDILVQIGTTYQEKHIDSIVTNTKSQTVTLVAGTTVAPSHGATVVKLTVNGTVAASPAPTTTTFDLTGGTLQEDDVILVEVGALYESTVVTGVTPGAGVQSIVVSPALSSAPSTGANAVINTAAGTVIIAAAPTTTAFTVIDGTTPCNVEEGDALLVDTSATATAAWEQVWITAVTDGDLRKAVTVTPALTAAPTAAHVVSGDTTYKLTSDSAVRPTFSCYVYLDGNVKFSFAGCLCNMTINDLTVGAIPKVEFACEAQSWTVESAGCSYTPAPNYSLKPPIVLGASLQTSTGGAFSELYVRNVECDLGVEMTRLEAIQPTSGTYAMRATNRAVTGSIDPYLDGITQYTAWEALESFAIHVKIADRLAKPNLVALRMPEVVRTSVDLEDVNGEWAQKIPYECIGNDDEEIYLSFLKTP